MIFRAMPTLTSIAVLFAVGCAARSPSAADETPVEAGRHKAQAALSGAEGTGSSQAIPLDNYPGNPKEADGTKALTVESEDGGCASMDALLVPNTVALDALCEDPLVALAIATDNHGCAYGEARAATFKCYAIDAGSSPTP
jgi:hypothetical protein